MVWIVHRCRGPILRAIAAWKGSDPRLIAFPNQVSYMRPPANDVTVAPYVAPDTDPA